MTLALTLDLRKWIIDTISRQTPGSPSWLDAYKRMCGDLRICSSLASPYHNNICTTCRKKGANQVKYGRMFGYIPHMCFIVSLGWFRKWVQDFGSSHWPSGDQSNGCSICFRFKIRFIYYMTYSFDVQVIEATCDFVWGILRGPSVLEHNCRAKHLR